jgi:hypothetical protein
MNLSKNASHSLREFREKLILKESGIISNLFYKDGSIYYLGMTVLSVLFW